MEAKLKAGIVGCGTIAKVHAAVLNQMDGVEFAACADIRPERARAMGDRYGLRAYCSLDEMLKSEKLDVLHICTPHYLHTPMARRAAESGAAVFTEKPPVISAAQWREFAALEGLTRVGICFQNRYNPNFLQAKELIGTADIGPLRCARGIVTWHRTAEYYLSSGWRGAWETEGGGALINQAVHTLDQIVQVMGAATSVECSMNQRHLRGVIAVEDTVEARLTFGEKPALFYASTGYLDDAPVLVEFCCEKATLRLEDDTLEVRYRDGRRECHQYALPEKLGKGYWGNGHAACIGDFYDSLRKGTPYQNDIASVKNTVDAMLAMYSQGRRTV